MKIRLAILLLIFLLGACSSPDPAPLTAPSTSTTQRQTLPPPQVSTATPFSPQATSTEGGSTVTPLPSLTPTLPLEGLGPDNFPPNVNPLTGLPVTNPALLDRRPLSVKVTLMPRSSRPQWGLSSADIVYEVYQNGGISRFHAVFYGQDVEQVGPVRSARFFDSEVIRMYNSIFAFGSADSRVLDRFGASEFAPYLVNEYPAGCGPMCRIDPNGFNYLVTNTANLSQYITELGVDNGRQDLSGMFFDNQAPTGGVAAGQIFVRYGPQVYHRWDFDRGTNQYLRFQDTRDDLGAGEEFAALVDRANNRQIAVDNVVIVLVPHEYFSRNPEIVEVNLVPGTGQAYAFRNGQMYEVQWSRPGMNSVLTLANPDGTSYPFKTGTTWFIILGQFGQPTQPAEDAWRFQFSIP